ncbi:Protein of unknown function DUF932 [uncultured Caudovirales phage]|jgi:hypothetical protein|uniref:DUF945 domain-containing protein n=1 Tax=uncultured Caudovirales phage TaxID=2100421 RepID=A0A6J5LB09_9CAUD|nr:Protein of unknown function DUF932 [uncultured Caudovirales phage]
MIRYASSSKQSSFRSQSALSNEQIAYHAPSVMASEAHESRGERYSFIPTIQVIDGLRAEGFQPYEIRQTKVRDAGKREHTKHMVRMRHASSIVADEVPEIILLNSHDGTSSYQIMSGVFRFVCSNGLIAGDMFNNIKVRHTGNVVGDVIEGATRVLEDAKQIGSRIGEYKAIKLDRQEQLAFATSALQVRWGDDQPVLASRLLQASRWQDQQDDLWTVYNRVQENMMKGGVPGRSSTGRRTTTRAVGGVTENVKLNKALWTLADTMAALKLDKATDQFIAAHEHAYL